MVASINILGANEKDGLPPLCLLPLLILDSLSLHIPSWPLTFGTGYQNGYSTSGHVSFPSDPHASPVLMQQSAGVSRVQRSTNEPGLSVALLLSIISPVRGAILTTGISTGAQWHTSSPSSWLFSILTSSGWPLSGPSEVSPSVPRRLSAVLLKIETYFPYIT